MHQHHNGFGRRDFLKTAGTMAFGLGLGSSLVRAADKDAAHVPGSTGAGRRRHRPGLQPGRSGSPGREAGRRHGLHQGRANRPDQAERHRRQDKPDDDQPGGALRNDQAGRRARTEAHHRRRPLVLADFQDLDAEDDRRHETGGTPRRRQPGNQRRRRPRWLQSAWRMRPRNWSC